MNNYCTNCGKKLEKNVKKCDNCNTYVVDLKTINDGKIFRVLCISIVALVLIIIGAMVGYYVYCRSLSKDLYEQYLKNDYKDARYVRYEICKICEGSCDGSCASSSKIIGCYRYYYKSNSKVVDPDIIIFYNKGEVSTDFYSSIINKYGFREERDEYEEQYLLGSRSYLKIKVDHINNDNIIEIYNMVMEIIDIYKKDGRQSFVISIFDESEENVIVISNDNMGSKFIFKWEFNDRIKLVDPKLDDVKKTCDSLYGYHNSLN